MKLLAWKRPSPAMVVALIALFVALGGTSYAALRIGSKQIVNNSIRSIDVRDNTLRGKDVLNGGLTGKDVANDSLTGADIFETSLGTVPTAVNATNASTLGGKSVTDLTVHCPTDTPYHYAGACYTTFKPASDFFSASKVCGDEGKKLPSASELTALTERTNATLQGNEISSSLYNTGTTFRYIAVNDAGVISTADTTTSNNFRCVGPMTN